MLDCSCIRDRFYTKQKHCTTRHSYISTNTIRRKRLLLSFSLSKFVLPLLHLFHFNPFPWTLFLIHYFLFSSPLLSSLISSIRPSPLFPPILPPLFLLFPSLFTPYSTPLSDLLFSSLLLLLCQIFMTTPKKRGQKRKKWWKTRSSIPPCCPGWPTRTDMSPRTLHFLSFICSSFLCGVFLLGLTVRTSQSSLPPPPSLWFSLLLILPITYVPTRISSTASSSLPLSPSIISIFFPPPFSLPYLPSPPSSSSSLIGFISCT